MAAPSSISIHITPREPGSSYKSISCLTWLDIPGLAVLTGTNGAGKTQLLEVLAYSLSQTLLPGLQPGSAGPLNVAVSGGTLKPEEVAFVPVGGRFSGGGAVGLAHLQSQRDQLIQSAQGMIPEHQSDIAAASRSRRIRAKAQGKNVNQLSKEEKASILPDDYSYMLDDVDVSAGLAFVIVAYQIRALEALDRGVPGKNADGTDLGPPPWDVVNEALLASGYAYELLSPKGGSLLDNYELRFKDKASANEVRAADLSSGEKVILQLVLWVFAAPNSGSFPKLLLLDEPDAHLHPSMTTQFMDVLSEVLVGRYGLRVIMTTHSPSTVALAPPGTVYRLKRGDQTIEQVSDRDEIIAELTAGLLIVSKSSKFCFVEDDDDVQFYEMVRDVLTESGPSRDPGGLTASPTIAFVAASVGTGSNKVAGGATVVAKWVDKLDQPPLNHIFLG